MNQSLIRHASSDLKKARWGGNGPVSANRKEANQFAADSWRNYHCRSGLFFCQNEDCIQSFGTIAMIIKGAAAHSGRGVPANSRVFCQFDVFGEAIP